MGLYISVQVEELMNVVCPSVMMPYADVKTNTETGITLHLSIQQTLLSKVTSK